MTIFCDICGNGSMSKIFERKARAFYRCLMCGLEKIYPQPSDTDLRSIYNNDYYKAWGVEIKDCEGVKKETFKARLGLIPQAKGKVILDCGCASGYLLEEAQEMGFIPYGIDINPAGLAIAGEKFSANRIFQGRLEESRFPDGFFYAIFMNDFLEHVRSPNEILSLAYSLIEPGGFLVIAAPDSGSLSRKISGRYWPHYKPEHLFYFNRKAIAICLSKANFLLVSIKKARKCLTLDYISSYFNKYPNKIVNLLLKITYLVPNSIKFKKCWLSLGEMAIVAQKPCS